MPFMEMEEQINNLLRLAEKLINYCVAGLPFMEELTMGILDACFAPRQILRQLGMIISLQVLLMIINASSKLSGNIIGMLTNKGRKRKKLMELLHRASTYSEWKNIANLLDELKRFDIWRKTDESSLYDVLMIKKRIRSTSDMLQKGDIFNLMFRLRGGLSRDQFGMQHEGLYSKAFAGTKLIVEKYHGTMSAALDFICDSPIMEEEIPTDARLAFFNETRHAYGRTALLLSGGAYLGYYHVGVGKALFEEGLLPRVISGASAGSIIVSLFGTRNEEELADFFGDGTRIGPPSYIRTDLFRFSDELRSPIARRLNYMVPPALRWMTFGLLSAFFEKKFLNMDTEHFKKAMMQNIGLYTFQEAFDRTGRVINITVAPLNNYDPPRLLNYLTAPHVCVWSAAVASSAVPGVFDSSPLMVKEPNGQYRPENEWTRGIIDKEDIKSNDYSDGSIESDLPMLQLSELFNVNHFIVSQANPHSAILSSLTSKATVWSNPMYGLLVGYLRFLMSQCRDWLKNIVNLLVFRSKTPLWNTKRGLTQTLTQEYEGRAMDVTIQPWAGHINPFLAMAYAIKNPTPEEYTEAIRVAEAHTWPCIARVRGHCLIEMTLDKCVQRLRKRITDESEKHRMDAARALFKQHSSGNIQDVPNRTMDRTPSFYTSRSIVNLSGLSVSDPLPPAAQARRQPAAISPHHHGSRGNLQQQQQQPQSRGLGDVWALHHSHDDIAHLGEADTPQVVDEDDFLNLTVAAGSVPMAKGQSLGQVSRSSSASDLQDDDMVLIPSTSNDNLKEEIYKTTRMANFYYKNKFSAGQQQDQEQEDDDEQEEEDA